MELIMHPDCLGDEVFWKKTVFANELCMVHEMKY